ncbi:hypothetical protein ACQP2X_39165 [Actinoplanes sp. CA-131856]
MSTIGAQVRQLLIDRACTLPEWAQLVLTLGCIQRCYPFYVRSLDEYPARRAINDAVDAGLAHAWVIAAGNPVNPMETAERAAALRAVLPEDSNDPLLDGDDSWITVSYGNLAEQLDLQNWPNLNEYVRATLRVTSSLVFTWSRWALLEAGATATRDETSTTSAFLFELATLARQVEWLTANPHSPRLIDRIRQDSITAGTELDRIVAEWRGLV